MMAGYDKIAEILIKAGANVNEKNQASPLHIAAMVGHYKVCELLLNSGADINAVNDGNKTPLDVARNFRSKLPNHFYKLASQIE